MVGTEVVNVTGLTCRRSSGMRDGVDGWEGDAPLLGSCDDGVDAAADTGEVVTAIGDGAL